MSAPHGHGARPDGAEGSTGLSARPVPPNETTLTFVAWSKPWTRHRARRYVLMAKAYGLTAEHEHDGGWTLRYHVITATGHDRDVRRYHRAVDNIRRRAEGMPSRAEEQRRIRDLLRTFTTEETC